MKKDGILRPNPHLQDYGISATKKKNIIDKLCSLMPHASQIFWQRLQENDTNEDIDVITQLNKVEAELENDSSLLPKRSKKSRISKRCLNLSRVTLS